MCHSNILISPSFSNGSYNAVKNSDISPIDWCSFVVELLILPDQSIRFHSFLSSCEFNTVF